MQGSAAGFTLAPTDELLSVENSFCNFEPVSTYEIDMKIEQVLQTYSTSLGLNVHALGFRLCELDIS